MSASACALRLHVGGGKTILRREDHQPHRRLHGIYVRDFGELGAAISGGDHIAIDLRQHLLYALAL